jgi:peptide/nickel transport system permease protein
MATSQITKLNGNSGVASLATEERASESLTRLALRRLRRDRLTLFAIGVLLTLTVLSFLAPVIEDVFDVSYTATNPTEEALPLGTPGHPLGTDTLGRDMLARLLYAGQVSLLIAFCASFLSTTIGVTIGLLAGYYQGGTFGFIDDLVMWFITTLNSIPTLMLLILIASVLTPSVPTLILVLTIISWTGAMRLVRGETISNREREYILSAKALGASPLRIMFMHILPNVFSILITALAIEIGTLILVESALSFLGLGVRPPTPSWGNMLTDAQRHFRLGAHLSILPGLLIVTTVLSLYLIGDGLRDAFDPRSNK